MAIVRVQHTGDDRIARAGMTALMIRKKATLDIGGNLQDTADARVGIKFD